LSPIKEVAMGVCRPVYPNACLDAIDKGSVKQKQKELSDAIVDKLQNDPDVKNLITQKKLPYPVTLGDIGTVLHDQDVKDLLVTKTSNTYFKLAKS
jgi:hypothetical protein